MLSFKTLPIYNSVEQKKEGKFTMQFFEIKAKCGHVGRGKYYEGIFYEIAENGRVAADIVRKRGRVKHDKKDAIISVRKVSFEEYQKGLENKENDLYFKCENIQDQNLIYDMICCNIKEEKNFKKH